MPNNKFLPPPIFGDEIDSLQGIEDNLDDLIEHFITPIETLRSISKPILNKNVEKISDNTAVVNNFSNLIISSNSQPLESRAHAFYRMLGLPVVAPDGSFYNAGFDPQGKNKKNLQRRAAIDEKIINSDLQDIINARENLFFDLLKIFEKQDLSASLYALVLRYPKPFNVLKENFDPLKPDPQVFIIDDRNSELNLFIDKNPQLANEIKVAIKSFDNTVVGNNLSGGRHLLKPFIIDPRIESTVMPDKNQICVPFLKDKFDTKLTSEIYLFRPGIELIIRDRLESQSEDQNFLLNIKKIINNDSKINSNNLNLDNLKNTVIALTDDNNLSNDSILNTFREFTSIQLLTTNRLIKLIKICIKSLASSMKKIDEARSYISWLPLPSILGPETGARGAVLNRVKLNTANSDLDIIITELRIKKLNAERQVKERPDLGNFASPFSFNLIGEKVKNYEQELQNYLQKRDKIAHEALEAMKVIEIVTGEVSGLGLVDILAIYAALWTIDLDKLIAFLDENSFQRLTLYNPTLKPLAEKFRGTDILTALTSFEQKVINILSFADKLLGQQHISPLEEIEGNLS